MITISARLQWMHDTTPYGVDIFRKYSEYCAMIHVLHFDGYLFRENGDHQSEPVPIVFVKRRKGLLSSIMQSIHMLQLCMSTRRSSLRLVLLRVVDTTVPVPKVVQAWRFFWVFLVWGKQDGLTDRVP